MHARNACDAPLDASASAAEHGVAGNSWLYLALSPAPARQKWALITAQRRTLQKQPQSNSRAHTPAAGMHLCLHACSQPRGAHNAKRGTCPS
eukprot:366465-Chlamydomonas_euryale.AAC.3